MVGYQGVKREDPWTAPPLYVTDMVDPKGNTNDTAASLNTFAFHCLGNFSAHIATV